MHRSLPSLAWFRAFEASARHLNFTAAAQEIGLTQSAVSQQVRSLELRLGAELFRRLPRGIALTDDGRKLLPQVSAALETLSAASASFENGAKSGLLSIATSVSVAQWLIAPHIKSFQAASPGLRIRFVSTVWPDEFRLPLADVEIRFGSEKLAGVGGRRLLPDDLAVIGRPRFMENLENQTLIEAVGTSQGWKHWAAASGARHLPPPSLFADSHGMALDLALQGAGIALTSSLLAEPMIRKNKISRLHPVSIPSTEGYFVAIRNQSEAAMHFSKWLDRIIN